MVKLGIVSAETLMYKNKDGFEIPTVVLIGRTEKGEKKVWRTVFYPYLYLTEEDYIDIKEQDKDTFTRYIKEVKGVKARTLTKKVITKLILKDSRYVTDFVRFLNKYNKVVLDKPIFTYEADLSIPTMLPIRFLIDNKIKSGVDITSKGKLIPVDMDIKLRKWYIDFEALSSKQAGHGPRKDEPIPIVSYYDNYLDTLYTLYVINPKWKEMPKFPKVIDKHIILGFKFEALVLDALTSMVKDYNPDIFTAWNLDRYDIVKWTQRMMVNNLDPKALSPFHSFSWKRLPYRIKGRILFDLMKAFKRFTDAELRSYSLGPVAEEENLGIEKVPLKKPTQWIWDNEPETLFKRNVNDVLIIKALDEKYDLVEMFNDLRKEFGVLFQEVLLNYRVLDTALMRFINDKVVLRTSFKAAKNKESYLGAVVIEPKPGQYHNIVQFDFNREYPSIIKAFNIGPETYRESDYTGPCYTIKYKDKIYKFAKKPRSLLAQLIDFFFSKRNEYEKEYQKAIENKDEVKIKSWYRKVFNIKKMTNAIYGVMDFPSFRLYKQECSAATAALGRIGIEQIKSALDSIGYEIIYGDTDSTFIQLKSKLGPEGCLSEAKEIVEVLNTELSKFFSKEYSISKAPAELGIKKIYSDYLLFAKKNYAGKSIWDEKKGFKEDLDMKGLEAIRSDSSDIEKRAVENIVKLVLDGEKEDAEAISKEYLKFIKLKKLTPIDVSYPLQLKADFKEYLRPNKNDKVSIPSHVRAAIYSNMFLDTDYTKEDKPRRLPIIVKEKIYKQQQTLFNDDIYPTEWEWEGQKFHLNGISITEDTDIPEWFIEKIDWQHIYDRLEGKLSKILSLVKKNE